MTTFAFIFSFFGPLKKVLVLQVKTSDIFQITELGKKAHQFQTLWFLGFVVFPPASCQFIFHFAHISYARWIGTDREIFLLSFSQVLASSSTEEKHDFQKKPCFGISPGELNYKIHFHTVSLCHLCLLVVCVVSELFLSFKLWNFRLINCIGSRKLRVFDDINVVWTEELLKAKAYPDKWRFGSKLTIPFLHFSVEFSHNRYQLFFWWNEWLSIFFPLDIIEIRYKQLLCLFRIFTVLLIE